MCKGAYVWVHSENYVLVYNICLSDHLATNG